MPCIRDSWVGSPKQGCNASIPTNGPATADALMQAQQQVPVQKCIPRTRARAQPSVHEEVINRLCRIMHYVHSVTNNVSPDAVAGLAQE